MLPAMPRPRHAAFGKQDRQVRLRRRLTLHQSHQINIAIGSKPCAIVVGIGDRRRQRDALHVGGERLEAGEAECEQIAALAIGEGVDLIDDDTFQRGEHVHAVFMAEQQRQRFRCGQQYMWRFDPLACLAVGRRVARPRLNADWQAHFRDRDQQIAANVSGQCLERGDVERVEVHHGF